MRPGSSTDGNGGSGMVPLKLIHTWEPLEYHSPCPRVPRSFVSEAPGAAFDTVRLLGAYGGPRGRLLRHLRP